MDAHHQEVTEETVATMTVAEVDDTEEDVMITVEVTAVMIAIVDMAVVTDATTMLLEESTATHATIDTAAVETTDVEAVGDTLIATRETTVALLARLLLQQVHTATQPLVAKLASHTEVDATMMREHPIVTFDC